MSSPAAGTVWYWTHNDGGGPKKQVLYAIDREGNTRASFPVIDVTLHDWEDIAIDSAGHLYIGDIGNNDSKRDALAVYEIEEPNPQAGAEPVSTKRFWNLRFPGAPLTAKACLSGRITATSSRRCSMTTARKFFAFLQGD